MAHCVSTRASTLKVNRCAQKNKPRASSRITRPLHSDCFRQNNRTPVSTSRSRTFQRTFAEVHFGDVGRNCSLIPSARAQDSIRVQIKSGTENFGLGVALRLLHDRSGPEEWETFTAGLRQCDCQAHTTSLVAIHLSRSLPIDAKQFTYKSDHRQQFT
jgi:hypothetical protein